jgi:D-alanine-D-alanine ligase
MTTVAVLAGGASDEREISLRSAVAVVRALKEAGYEVIEADPAHIDKSELLRRIKKVDVVFPVLHGIGGEDGTLQSWLESNSIVYIGADSNVSAFCFDKRQSKPKLQELGLITPRGETVELGAFQASGLSMHPYVLKPYDGGSSVDTFIVRNPAAADISNITDAFDRHGSMVLEELIDGPEITVGVLGEQALPVIEIIPPADQEFDYENKYNGKTQELCPPQNIPEDVQAEAQRIALKLHRELGILDMSRTDMIVRRSDNAIVVLETNTIPGMTDQSLLPKAAAAAGITMPELVSRLVESALSRGASV